VDRFAPLVSRLSATRRSRRRAIAALSLLALAAGALHPRAAHALTQLDETQLAQVRGQDGSFQLQRQAATSTPPLLKSLLGLLPASDFHVTQLDRHGFEVALAAQGLKPFDASFYNGGPVSQVQVDGPPVNASFELGQLIAGSFNLNYQGPSMGTININGLNASGTTLWVWTH
jgi:hypothetical protein